MYDTPSNLTVFKLPDVLKVPRTDRIYNAHAYLSDLPQDLDVVAVEPLRGRTRHAHRYLRSN